MSKQRRDGTGVLRPSDQLVTAWLLAVCMLLFVLYWSYLQLRFGLVEIDRAPARSLCFQIDVNQAAWPELTLLPRIGETLARRIVRSREAEGPYREVGDLRRVKGIGPKTIDRLRPYVVCRPPGHAQR